MADVLIRNIDKALHERLIERAASHGRSLEEEARELLRLGLANQAEPQRENLASLATRLFGTTHGMALTLAARGSAPEKQPIDFSHDPAAT